MWFYKKNEEIEKVISESGCTYTPEEIKDILKKGVGTCYCFMNLNEMWENLPTEIADSISGKLPNFGIEGFFTRPHYFKFDEEEGINMMSMLFCKFGGGCITALESGQDSFYNDLRYQKLIKETERRKGRLEDFKINFVLEVFPLALEDEKKSGIPAEITFAQICLESEYGTKACIDINTKINGNNYFGIKGSGPAGSVVCLTKEEVNGKIVQIEDNFKAYNSMEESIEDHTKLLLNVYKKYTTTGSVEDWCDALVKGGYSTSSKYKETILDVIYNTWKLG